MPIIESQNLTKQVVSPEGTLTILDNVSLALDAGEACAIVGASGSGKSTLLGLLAGLDTDARACAAGRHRPRYTRRGRGAPSARRVGLCSSVSAADPHAIENVMLPLELADEPAPAEAAREVLARVGLADRASHYPSQLSGGEQQRVAIARAFAARPKILFADEPTGNLDQATGTRITELLFSLNREHATTLVLVTHDESLARHCSRRLRLEAGRAQDDKPKRTRRPRVRA
jgi:putative ABC transport system ATP-binding protein